MTTNGFYPDRDRSDDCPLKPADRRAPNRNTRRGLRLALPALMIVAGPAIATHAPPHAAPPAACTGLTSDMDHLSKSMAMNFADGITDNSAARATRRETEYNGLLARVRLTMDLMRDNHCATPRAVPTGAEYTTDALTCHTDMLKAELDGTGMPSSCVQSNWIPRPH